MRTHQPKQTHLLKFLIAFSLFIASGASQAQTVFWSDNFDTPTGGAENNNAGAGWTLNSEGNSSNRWFINAPAGIGCSSSGNVLHISCDGLLCGFLGGPDEPIYNAAGNLTRTAVSPVISTVGQSNITLSFDFICEGYAGSDYGTVALSSDGGTTWTDLPGQYVEVSSCSTKTISVPAQYQNISTFKMRFKWQESSTSNGVDPPFSVDNIKLTVPSGACTPPTVSAGTNVSICPGGSIAIGGAPTATGGSEVGAYVYSWTNAASLNSASSANPTASPSSTTTYSVTVHRGTPSCSATSSVTVTVNTPQTLSISASGSTTICPGGNVGLTASSGFSSYAWTTPAGSQTGQTISATQAGNYTVSANDANSCLSTSTATTVSLGSSQNIVVTPSGPLSFCQGGSVTLSAAAGFGTYTWSNGFVGQNLTVTQSGSYSVIGSGTGCGGLSPDVVVSVSQPAPLTVTADGSLQLCANDNVTLTAEAGFSNYTWSNGTNGASLTTGNAGNYTVTAEDANGCTVTSAIQSVSNDPGFTIMVTPSGTIDMCSGESIVLTASAGYSNYVWSNSTGGTTLTVNSGGAYSVSAQNSNGCTGTSDAIFVNETTAPNASFSYVQEEELYTITFTSTFSADTYLWSFGNNQTSTEANPVHTFPFDNTYPVTLIATNDCGSDTVTLDVVVIKTGIETMESLNSFSMSPNPGVDFIRMNGNSKKSEMLTISIYSINGQLIQSTTQAVKGSFSFDINTSKMASGAYMIVIADDSSRMARKWFKH